MSQKLLIQVHILVLTLIAVVFSIFYFLTPNVTSTKMSEVVSPIHFVNTSSGYPLLKFTEETELMFANGEKVYTKNRLYQLQSWQLTEGQNTIHYRYFVNNPLIKINNNEYQSLNIFADFVSPNASIFDSISYIENDNIFWNYDGDEGDKIFVNSKLVYELKQSGYNKISFRLPTEEKNYLYIEDENFNKSDIVPFEKSKISILTEFKNEDFGYSFKYPKKLNKDGVFESNNKNSGYYSSEVRYDYLTIKSGIMFAPSEFPFMGYTMCTNNESLYTKVADNVYKIPKYKTETSKYTREITHKKTSDYHFTFDSATIHETIPNNPEDGFHLIKGDGDYMVLGNGYTYNTEESDIKEIAENKNGFRFCTGNTEISRLYKSNKGIDGATGYISNPYVNITITSGNKLSTYADILADMKFDNPNYNYNQPQKN